jgi:hypothetical protein
MSPYRGTLSFDEPTRWKSSAPRWKRLGTCAGNGRDAEHYKEWKRAWRDKNREHVRVYHREYFRKYVSVNRP